jgi:hypothetical protein
MLINSLQDVEKGIQEHSSSLEENAVNQLQEIINDCPAYIKDFIEESFEYKRIPKEYLFSSILFAFSNAAGLAFQIDSLGYSNYGNIYLALIGSRGDAKSPAMDLATAPLNEFDNQQYKLFKEKSLDDGSSETVVRKQLLIQDATVEAAYYKHHQNPFSLGIFMDELYHLIEKMGNPSSKDGPAWRQLLLQGNTNKHVDISRKTTESFRLPKAYPVLLGSIQEEFIPKMFSGGNEESGLTDRLLFTPKLTHNSKLSRYKIGQDCLRNYSDNLLRIMEHRSTVEKQSLDEPFIITCIPEAEDLLFNYTQKLLDNQKEAESGEKEYLSKVQINIHKMVLILHLIKQSAKPELCLRIEPETVTEAIRIMEFYLTNFKIIRHKLEGQEKSISINDVIKLGIKNKATQESISAVLGVHKSTICRKMAKLKL